jgi:hypothetical protein
MKSFLFSAAVLLSTSAFGAGLHDCNGLDSIGNLIAAKSIGSVKVAYVSTEEPAVAPDHVLIFIYDQQMGHTCTAISQDVEGRGFGFVDMTTLKSIAYDAQKGRLFQIKVTLPRTGMEDGEIEKIQFRTNAITGKVTLE